MYLFISLINSVLALSPPAMKRLKMDEVTLSQRAEASAAKNQRQTANAIERVYAVSIIITRHIEKHGKLALAATVATDCEK